MDGAIALFAWLISHQPTVLFSHNKPATSNQPAVLFSQNKSAPAISHQPNEQAACCFRENIVPWHNTPGHHARTTQGKEAFTCMPLKPMCHRPKLL
jgi:hypothetical protein